MALSPADRQALREFWSVVRADPAKLWRLLFLVAVLVISIGGVLTALLLLADAVL